MRRRFLFSLITLFICFAVNSQKPNIIFIYADDWGYGDLSCHGHSTITTPNLDKLAQEGTEFLQFNVCNPVCSPSRTAIMTGRFPARFFVHQHFADHDLNMSRDMPDWLDPEVPMLPGIFKNAGYSTAHYGKWHLTNAGVKDPPPPSEYGYDDSRVFNGPGPQVGVPIGVATGSCVDYAMDFIRQHKNGLFFINLWIHESHQPIEPPQEAKDEYVNVDEPYRTYYACISYADTELGRLFQFLKEESLDSTTLVIFSSDNGPEESRVDPENKLWYSRGETGGLRGQKRSLHEGGVGLPFIVHWPGKVPAGTFNNATNLAGIDMVPTLCAIAGIDLPEGYESDGENLSDAFFGSPLKRTKPVFWEWRGTSHGENWPRLAVRSGDWKLLSTYDDSQQTLYNIQANRKEENDSSGFYPAFTDSLFNLALSWKQTLPENIPFSSIEFRTNSSGEGVIVDFSETGASLANIINPVFRLFRSEKFEEIPIINTTSDDAHIFLQIDPEITLTANDLVSIGFYSGKITDSDGRILLYFSTEPVINQIKPPVADNILTFIITDPYTGNRLSDVIIQIDSLEQVTNINGEASFHLSGSTSIIDHFYTLSRTGYFTLDSFLMVVSDTTISINLFPSVADIKFRILSDSKPINQAEIEIDKKKSKPIQLGL